MIKSKNKQKFIVLDKNLISVNLPFNDYMASVFRFKQNERRYHVKTPIYHRHDTQQNKYLLSYLHPQGNQDKRHDEGEHTGDQFKPPVPDIFMNEYQGFHSLNDPAI